MQYYERVVDQILKEKLESKGAVVVEGPRWCGKTTTSEKQAKSVIYVDDPLLKPQYIEMSRINVKALLTGETPLLIDEWQIIPKVWDAIRFEVDHRNEVGQFILTGSSTPIKSDEITHSGIGRYTWVTMRPCSLFESKDSSGEVSLMQLFNQDLSVFGNNKLSLEDIAYLTCRGGWPGALNKKKTIALNQAKDYYEALYRENGRYLDEALDASRIKRLMRSYARNVATSASWNSLAQDLDAVGLYMSTQTISKYINRLTGLFVIEESKSWNPNLRSKTAIRSSDTHYFVDPSIACAALELSPNDLINDLNTFGMLFENLVIRDLRVYASLYNGQVYHYRDKNGLECDAVVHIEGGKYGLVEIKLGSTESIDLAANNLNKLESLIDSTKMNKPSFKAVVTAVSKFAYRREDGVYVVPVGCLKP